TPADRPRSAGTRKPTGSGQGAPAPKTMPRSSYLLENRFLIPEEPTCRPVAQAGLPARVGQSLGFFQVVGGPSVPVVEVFRLVGQDLVADGELHPRGDHAGRDLQLDGVVGDR